MIGANLSEGEAKQQQPSKKKSTEEEFAAEWQAKATRDEEYNFRDQCDLPIGQEELQ